MPAPLDLTGKPFGRLTAREFVGRNAHGKRLWRCECSCGGERVVAVGLLTSGEVASCGCHRSEVAAETLRAGRDPDAWRERRFPRRCRQCRKPFAAVRGEWYCSESCWTVSRAAKRQGQRAGLPGDQAAVLTATLKIRAGSAHDGAEANVEVRRDDLIF